MNPLIISAPFGNYHKFLKCVTQTKFTPTLGTFTWENRGFWTKPYGGTFTRLLLSLRYSPLLKSWTNKVGLKNPGIRWYRNQVMAGKTNACDKIISIYGYTKIEWENLVDCCMYDIHPHAVEVNTSCPNNVTGNSKLYQQVFERLMNYGLTTIVKISPVNYSTTVEIAYKTGIRNFHATNTLPVSRGGMSGKALMPISLSVVESLRMKYPNITIIGGGGVTSTKDALEYLVVGADHVSIGSMLFNPFNWKKVKSIAETIERGIKPSSY